MTTVRAVWLARHAHRDARFRRRSALRRLAPAAVVVALAAGACGARDAPRRIVYPAPWLGAAVGRLAQRAIDDWGPRPAAEIPESLMASAHHSPGYAGDVEYAEAMASLPGVVAAVGPQSSRSTLLVAPIYAERHIPLICATATTDRLRALGPWVFRLAPSDRAEGAFIARFVVHHLGARRVAVFYLDADEYGLGLRDGLVRELQQLGATPVDQVGIIEETDLPRRVAESLRRARPDVVVVAARATEALPIARAVHARAPRVAVVAGDGAPLNADFIRSAGPAAASVYAVAWWDASLSDSLSRSFTARFERVARAPPSAAVAMYYDAIMVAARAVRAVGPDRDAVRRYLSGLGTARPPYRGVTGPISFAPDRHVNLLMTHVVHGVVAVVDTVGARP